MFFTLNKIFFSHYESSFFNNIKNDILFFLVASKHFVRVRKLVLSKSFIIAGKGQNEPYLRSTERKNTCSRKGCYKEKVYFLFLCKLLDPATIFLRGIFVSGAPFRVTIYCKGYRALRRAGYNIY